MTSPALQVNEQYERLAELLADQALEGLSKEQELELETLLAAHGAERDFSLMAASATLEMALMRPEDFRPMPVRAQRRLQRAGHRWSKATSRVLRPASVYDSPAAEMVRRTQRLVFTAGPWLAAAACLLLALVAWWPNSTPDIVTAMNRADSVAITLADWNDPEVKGVQGEVVWCDQLQKGYLRLANLPPNDPAKEQYQIWIVDDRGMGQRISGGIFDVKEPGETIVPINPGIPVQNAKAFAVTIENPGGCWVSDMTRRVAIASR